MSRENQVERPLEKAAGNDKHPPRRTGEQAAAGGFRQKADPARSGGARPPRRKRRPGSAPGPQSGFRPREGAGKEAGNRQPSRRRNEGSSNRDRRDRDRERKGGAQLPQELSGVSTGPARSAEKGVQSAKSAGETTAAQPAARPDRADRPDRRGRGAGARSRARGRLSARRQVVENVETLADLKAENERLLKEINLELASIQTVTLE